MLTIKRPTSTTVLYKISTARASDTITSHLTKYLSAALRILVASLVATVLLMEYRTATPIDAASGTMAWLEEAVIASPSGHLATLLISNIGKIWRLALCAAVTWLISRKGYTEESLLAIRGLGVQTSTSSPSYLWSSSTRFIPTSSIQDIFIHEAFDGYKVKYYLMIVVEKEDDVVVVFPVSLCPTWLIKHTYRRLAEYPTTERDHRNRLEGYTKLPL